MKLDRDVSAIDQTLVTYGFDVKCPEPCNISHGCNVLEILP